MPSTFCGHDIVLLLQSSVFIIGFDGNWRSLSSVEIAVDENKAFTYDSWTTL